MRFRQRGGQEAGEDECGQRTASRDRDCSASDHGTAEM